jgi:hypothetical protein
MEPEKVREIIESLQQALPPIFLGSRADELTGGVVCWGTVQNKRSRREIPEECFARSAGRVLIIRDRFLEWWAGTLSEARRPPILPPPRRTRRAAHPGEEAQAGQR